MTAKKSVKPLGGSGRPAGTFAAEVRGVDLSAPLADPDIAWITQTLSDQAVVVFRDQELDANAMDRFARCFGVPQQHVLEKYRHPDIPEISFVTNLEADGSVDAFGVKRATFWHTDATYEAKLPRLAMLHALRVPGSGGGTYFADMRAAWDDLPEAERAGLRTSTGLHRFNAGPAGGARMYSGQAGTEQAFEDQKHPAMAIHPASERPILFVNPAHTHGFEGMSASEGWALVEALTDHSIQDQFVYRHQWRTGDLLLWDELATMHCGAGDSDPQEPRVLMRSIVYPP